jgi:predicted nucleic acid-binding protein
MGDLFDTCVFIDYWKGDTSAVSLVKTAMNNPGTTFFSPLSALELWQYDKLGRQEEIEYIALTRYFLKELPLNSSIAIKAGQWLRGYSREARMKLSDDALIAATADEVGADLCTRNITDSSKFYQKIKAY